MKSERGITLISLIIYVILITFVVAGVSAITTSFYTNINDLDKTSESAVELAKFNMYFIKDIKAEKAKVVSVSRDQVQLSFASKDGRTEQVKYSFQNNSLYRDKVKICGNVKDIEITGQKGSDGNYRTVTIKAKINNYEKTTLYSIEPKPSTSESGSL